MHPRRAQFFSHQLLRESAVEFVPAKFLKAPSVRSSLNFRPKWRAFSTFL